MTIEEKRAALIQLCDASKSCSDCPLYEARVDWDDCLYGHGDDDMYSDSEIEDIYAIAFPTPEIKDSGNRREFSTGAVRDVQEGKGRCDLLPLDVVADYMVSSVLHVISDYTDTGDYKILQGAIEKFCVQHPQYRGAVTMLLEVSKHFEAGAKKYGERNWEKGIPTHCYIDSAVRHYLKWLRGDTDEPHDRAFVWNILCCIWTCKHMPELNDYRHEDAQG